MIGNGQLLPSGPLRERLNAIKRADCVIINGARNLDFEEKIYSIKKEINIFYSFYKIKNIEKYYGKKIAAFAGIGNPENFFNLLKENKIDLIKTYIFPDHHNYSKKDFEIMKKENLNMLVTTEKDFNRMNEEQKKNCNIIEVDLEIENMQKFKELIQSYL